MTVHLSVKYAWGKRNLSAAIQNRRLKVFVNIPYVNPSATVSGARHKKLRTWEMPWPMNRRNSSPCTVRTSQTKMVCWMLLNLISLGVGSTASTDMRMMLLIL